MAKQTNIMEDLVRISAKLPWWINILLAIAAYIILHTYAEKPPPTAVTDAAQLGAHAIHSIWQGLATFGQYVLPFLFLLAAVLSFVAQKRRRNLLQRAAQAQDSAAAIRGMTWREFEMLMGEIFREQGYRVSDTADGADGGVDLILHKGAEKYFVQCKHRKAQKVSVNIVRELHGVMLSGGAVGGFVVTSGSFTRDAKQYADGLNIELLDGAALHPWIAQTKQSRELPSALVSPLSENDTSPACPRCGGTMVKRTARQEQYAGKTFWGCSQYPQCRGILSAERE